MKKRTSYCGCHMSKHLFRNKDFFIFFYTKSQKDTLQFALKIYWNECIGNLTYHFGHPVGSTALVAASAPVGSWGCELGERHQGVYSEAPGTHPVWADSSGQGQLGRTINSQSFDW